MPDAQKCPECECYNTHSIECPHLTLEQARQHIRDYRAAWIRDKEPHQLREKALQEKLMDEQKKRAQQVTFWAGKFLMVKTENNALRKKLK